MVGIFRKFACFGGANVERKETSQAARKGNAPEPRAVASSSSAEQRPNPMRGHGPSKVTSASPQPNRAAAPTVARDRIPAIDTSQHDVERLKRVPNLYKEQQPAEPGQQPLTIHTFGEAPRETVTCATTAFAPFTADDPSYAYVPTGGLVQSKGALASDGFGPCVPIMAVYPGGERAMLHLSNGSHTNRIDMLLNKAEPPENDERTQAGLTQEAPTDVYIVCRQERHKNQRWHQTCAVVHLVNNAPPNTNIHVVTVQKGTLGVRAEPGLIDIRGVDS